MKERTIKEPKGKGKVSKGDMKKAVKKVVSDRAEKKSVADESLKADKKSVADKSLKNKKAAGGKNDKNDNSIGQKTGKSDGKSRKK